MGSGTTPPKPGGHGGPEIATWMSCKHRRTNYFVRQAPTGHGWLQVEHERGIQVLHQYNVEHVYNSRGQSGTGMGKEMSSDRNGFIYRNAGRIKRKNPVMNKKETEERQFQAIERAAVNLQ